MLSFVNALLRAISNQALKYYVKHIFRLGLKLHVEHALTHCSLFFDARSSMYILNQAHKYYVKHIFGLDWNYMCSYIAVESRQAYVQAGKA